jgi:hypothetical protein
VVVVPFAIEEEKMVVDEQVNDEIMVVDEVTSHEEAVEQVAVDEQAPKEEPVITVEAIKEEAADEESVNEETINEQVDLIKQEETNDIEKESNKENSESNEEKEPSEEKESNEQVPPTVKRKPTANRRLNQVEAVVLPGNQQEAIASLSSVNVQFGSLNLNQSSSDSEIEEEVKETVIQEKKEEPVMKEKQVPVAKEPVIQQKEPPVVVQAPIVQPQAVAPPVLQESYISATSYSTFVPNTMTAYHHGIIAPTTAAEYTVYNPEPQRMVMNTRM